MSAYRRRGLQRRRRRTSTTSNNSNCVLRPRGGCAVLHAGFLLCFGLLGTDAAAAAAAVPIATRNSAWVVQGRAKCRPPSSLDRQKRQQVQWIHSHRVVSTSVLWRGSLADNNHDGNEETAFLHQENGIDTPQDEASDGNDDQMEEEEEEEEVEQHDVDVAIVGAGIGGLCAGAILNSVYGKKVGIYESHYLAGGCAHAFERRSKDGRVFTFDSGPTIVLGCSTQPYNPLRQVLNAVDLGDAVEWIPYQGWGMVEHPGKEEEEFQWNVELGPDAFRNGPLLQFGGPEAVAEFDALRNVTFPLVSGAVSIPAMAMRPGATALIPLLRYLPALWNLIQLGPQLTTGTFAPYMDGPLFRVQNPWLRHWLDALAFSLSGLPASRTAASAMAYVLYDMHREGAALDYPRGGLGSVIAALVQGVEQGSHGSRVHLQSHVRSMDTNPQGTRFTGLTVAATKGKKRRQIRVSARDGVICNIPLWSISSLITNPNALALLNGGVSTTPHPPPQSWIVPPLSPGETMNDIRGKVPSSQLRQTRPPASSSQEESLLQACNGAEMTGSFLHLHLALNATGLDWSALQPHYTVMDRGLGGGNHPGDSACGQCNMIAVSNPCVLDPTLAPPGTLVLHAYGAANEPYDLWESLPRSGAAYRQWKDARAQVLWRAVESILPTARQRTLLALVGTPQTHQRFLRRPRGTYGAATEDYLKDGSTPLSTLVLCGDGIFPGIGVPAVALSGASAANAMVSPWRQWTTLDTLQNEGLLGSPSS